MPSIFVSTVVSGWFNVHFLVERMSRRPSPNIISLVTKINHGGGISFFSCWSPPPVVQSLYIRKGLFESSSMKEVFNAVSPSFTAHCQKCAKFAKITWHQIFILQLFQYFLFQIKFEMFSFLKLILQFLEYEEPDISCPQQTSRRYFMPQIHLCMIIFYSPVILY